MQITGNFFTFQTAAQLKANEKINPLLKQAINAIGQADNTKESGAISKEMEAKIRQNTEEAKIDPSAKQVRKLQEELMILEQDLYGSLGHEADRLNGLVKQQDFYNNVLNGTADRSTAMSMHFHYNPEDTEQFEFMDFNSYLDAKGYERTNFNPFESSVVYVEGEYYGYNLMEEDNGIGG